MNARKGKPTDYPLNAPSTIVRQAMFPSGPGSYPNQITPLHQPQQNRQYLTRQQVDNWAHEYPNEHKWREMGWSTSYPAEYLLQANCKDYKQTLAYAEEMQSRQDLQHYMPDTGNNIGAIKSPAKAFVSRSGNFPRSTSFSNTTMTATTRGVAEVGSSQSEEERSLLKYAMLREGLLSKLHALIKAATPPQSLLQPHLPPKEPNFDITKGTEVLHLLLQMRDTGVMVMESILRWHELRIRLAPMVPLAPFRFENRNYCAKMMSDLNFLSTIKSLGTVLGINPATMKQNPFMMPKPIPERDFLGLCDTPWRSLQLFDSRDDPVQRVAEAEKYLVWCLLNLQDVSNSPVRALQGNSSPSASSLKKREQQQKVTWQKRAEKQLEMLSMPLESLSGPTYVMDSSRMMKRKGVLPSLPQSPPKTLRELMENVHYDGVEDDGNHSDNNRSRVLRTYWSGKEFSANAADFEELGANNVPPHHMVTLVAASVLILLSPSDRLPKDLSWHSCQKMLRYGGRLIERVQTFDVSGVPAFKWKALVPFLQNELFQPTFLAQFSCAASSLCAWVFSVLRAAQQQDYQRLGLHTSSGATTGGDEDRLVLLSELEVDAAVSPQTTSGSPTSWDPQPGNGSSLPPLSRSRSGKRVSIGSAEVLFINENQPVVSSTPRGLSRSSSLRSESPAAASRKKSFAVTSLRSGGESSALLRTSPWSYRGVVYFVSFFLQEETEQSQQDEAEAAVAEERHLLIKIYEPMSSVESQMIVETEDLRQDFGEEALAAFQHGKYRTLCDLMLHQLDRMMGAENPKAGPVTPPLPTEEGAPAPVKRRPRPTGHVVPKGETRKQENALDLLLQDSDEEHPEEPSKVELQQSSAAASGAELEASAMKIQCLARQQQARHKVNRVRAAKQQAASASDKGQGVTDASAVKIQSLARQKQARQRVDRVRAEKQQAEASAVKIQCLARQQQARRKVDRVRAEKHQVVAEQQQGESPASRPGTVMSYASDAFEDDQDE